MLCLGRKETAEIGLLWPPKGPANGILVFRSQIRTVQSAEPEMSCLPSLENDNEEAKFVWPVCAKDCLISHHIPDVDNLSRSITQRPGTVLHARM